MLVALLLLAFGAALLFAGGEVAVRGAAGLARAAGIPAFALGALLFGVDLEGLGGAVAAAARGETAIAAGEVFGAVVFLFSAAFGAALLLGRGPLPAPPPQHVLVPGAAVVAVGMVAHDTHVARVEGALLLWLYLGYVVFVVWDGRLARERGEQLEREALEGRAGRVRPALLALGGLGGLALGAALLVEGGVRMLGLTALAPGFVGAAVLGTLASLDEVMLEVLPVRRGNHDLATGNLFGTLAAFCTGVIGITALVRPLDLDGGALAALLYAAVLYAVVGGTFLWRGAAGRVLGLVVIASYAVWLALASKI